MSIVMPLTNLSENKIEDEFKECKAKNNWMLID